MAHDSRTTLCSKCRNPSMFKPRVNVNSSANPSNSMFNTHEIRETILLSEKDLEDYDTEIARLQSQLISVREQRKRLDDYKTQLQWLLSPLREVPNEILFIIFELACTDNFLQEYPWPMDKYYSREPVTKPFLPIITYLPSLAISAVCTRWRSLMLASPSLWSDLRLETVPNETVSDVQSGFMSTLRLYLDRSVDAPLRIGLQTLGYLNFQNNSPALNLILDHTCRWETFRYVGDYQLKNWMGSSFSFPSLTNLILKGCDNPIVTEDLDCFADAPKLRAVRTDVLEPDSNIPWTQLTAWMCGHLKERIV
ncbi:hypothetical protein BT96DRAFT_146412 [Gymnopus androsaceus JB14]|uniref:Uncharacterized protein n=1 Tax=Gymnopus androsaceus JB14 TaxID=1447944 RepID=A0A6A4HCJ8_9AGAR|nr:hypothetical protein BT96DRAFT_146412 [Gymnopus androsaceus JB14]